MKTFFSWDKYRRHRNNVIKLYNNPRDTLLCKSSVRGLKSKDFQPTIKFCLKDDGNDGTKATI